MSQHQRRVAVVVAEADSQVYPDEYFEGIRLFNAEHFWHSHEQWEICWHRTSNKDTALFYKGIIQAAAALVHWQRGNPRGLHLNWSKSRSKLECLRTPYMGIDLEQFCAAMNEFIALSDAGVKAPVPTLEPVYEH